MSEVFHPIQRGSGHRRVGHIRFFAHFGEVAAASEVAICYICFVFTDFGGLLFDLDDFGLILIGLSLFLDVRINVTPHARMYMTPDVRMYIISNVRPSFPMCDNFPNILFFQIFVAHISGYPRIFQMSRFPGCHIFSGCPRYP